MNDRLWTLLRALIAEAIAPTMYHVPVRYRVVTETSGRYNLQIVRKARGFPDLLPLSVRTGVPGAKGDPTPGAVVLVSFVEGDPSLPVVTHYSEPDDPAFVPISSSLDATGTVRIGASSDLVDLGNGTELVGSSDGRVVCYGDEVTVGTETGFITPVGAFAKVKAR